VRLEVQLKPLVQQLIIKIWKVKLPVNLALLVMNVLQQLEHFVDQTLLTLQLLTLTSIVLLVKETESTVLQVPLLKSLELIKSLIVNNAQEDITVQMHLIQLRSSLVVLEPIVILELQPQQVQLLVLLVIIVLQEQIVQSLAHKENSVQQQVSLSPQGIVLLVIIVDMLQQQPLQ